MHTMELMERRTRAAEDAVPSLEDMARRIETVMRVKALSGGLRPTRERHFNETMRSARDGAASTKAVARAAASSMLDILTLELCDE